MWLYSQYFTQLDDYFTCDIRQRCLLLIKTRSEKLVWLSPTVFSGKGKNTVLGRQRADKVVLLRLGFIRGKFKGSRIVTASRSGPQSEKSATRWRKVRFLRTLMCQLETDHYDPIDKRLSTMNLNVLRWIFRTVFLSARFSKHSGLRGARGRPWSPTIFSYHLDVRYNLEFL